VLVGKKRGTLHNQRSMKGEKAIKDGNTIAVYLPVGGEVSLALPKPVEMYGAQWFNPCTGELSAARLHGMPVAAPKATRNGHPQDWVLVLRLR